MSEGMKADEELTWHVARALSVPEHHTTWDLLTDQQKDLYFMQAEYAISAVTSARTPAPSSSPDVVETDLVHRAKMVAMRCSSMSARTPVAGEPDPDWWERQSALGDACDKIHEMIFALEQMQRRVEAMRDLRDPPDTSVEPQPH